MTRSITYLTPQAYLEQERIREGRCEYENGKLIPMSGASKEHNRIVRNLITLFWNILSTSKENQYEVYGSDLRTFSPTTHRYYYPDIIITKGEEKYQDDTFDTLLNPYILIEVLSEGTKNRDRTIKFEAYRHIPGFVEYVLIDQYTARLEGFYKNERGEWVIREPVLELESQFEFHHLNFSLSLSDIYQRVQFKPSPEEEDAPQK